MDGCNYWLGHKWGRWSAPELKQKPEKPEGVANLLQTRECVRCGMVQKYAVVCLSSPE